MALDNVLFAQIISILNAGFTSIVSLVPTAPIIVQSFQPVQQGANSEPSLYLYKISDERMGFPARQDVWNINTEQMVETTTQQYLTKFQLTAWAIQDPSNVSSLTASDYANYAAYVMQSAAAVTSLEGNGFGILDVSQVRNPPFTDDYERFEFAPSFDFTISHKQIIALTTPVITETVLQIYDV